MGRDATRMLHAKVYHRHRRWQMREHRVSEGSYRSASDRAYRQPPHP